MKELAAATETSLPPLGEPEVIFDRDVYNKIMHWVHKSDDEVSGLGTIIRLENGDFKVASAMMLPQKNTGGSTDIDGVDVAKAMYELRKEPGTLNFWWHSHVNMGVFWSKTDTDTIQSFGGGGGTGGFVVSTVFNKKNENRTSIYSSTTFGEKPLNIFMDEVKIRILSYYPQTTFDAWNAEYDKNVIKRIVPAYPAQSHFDDDEYGHWDFDTGKFKRPVLKGLVSLKEKMLGSTLQNVGTGYKKFPIDRNGNVVGPSVLPTAEFWSWVITDMFEANMLISDAELNSEPEQRSRLLATFTEIELNKGNEIQAISDHEFEAEMNRRQTSALGRA